MTLAAPSTAARRELKELQRSIECESDQVGFGNWGLWSIKNRKIILFILITPQRRDMVLPDTVEIFHVWRARNPTSNDRCGSGGIRASVPRHHGRCDGRGLSGGGGGDLSRDGKSPGRSSLISAFNFSSNLKKRLVCALISLSRDSTSEGVTGT